MSVSTDKRKELILGAISGNNDVPTDPRTKEEKLLVDIANFAQGGSTSNGSTKKIYIHPIILYAPDSNLGLSLFIFDNVSTPYNTWAKVKTKLKSIATSISDTCRVPVSGSAYTTAELIARNIDVTTGGVVTLYGRYPDGTNGSLTITDYEMQAVYDGVNAIN